MQRRPPLNEKSPTVEGKSHTFECQLGWTADGLPQQRRYRSTSQWTTSVSKSRPTQVRTRGSTCLFRRRAAMTRGVLSNTISTRTVATGWALRQDYKPLELPFPFGWRMRTPTSLALPPKRAAVKWTTTHWDSVYEDHSVGCFTIACSLDIEHAVCMQLGIHRIALAAHAAGSPTSARPHWQVRANRWFSRVLLKGH